MSNIHHIGGSPKPATLIHISNAAFVSACDAINYARARVALLDAIDFEAVTGLHEFGFGLSLALEQIAGGLQKAAALLSGEEPKS